MTANIMIVRLYASRLIDARAEEEIKSVTERSLDHLEITVDGPYYIEYDDGDFDEKEPFEYLSNGVSFVIYENSTVIYGQTPSVIDQLPDILYYQIHQIVLDNDDEWLIYDVPIDNVHTLRGFYNVSNASSIADEMIRLMLIISPLILVASGLGGYFIIYVAFKPVRYISETAQKIKETKAFNLRVKEPQSKDEVANLTIMINQMLDQMEQAIIREQEFSSNVSHELRTPLTVLRAQIEYLEEKNKDYSIDSDIKDILKQLYFIEHMIKQLLELSRSKHIRESAFEIIDAYQITKDVLLSLNDMMESKQITFTLEPFDKDTTLETSPALFIRILHNIITNAIKYNKTNGTILISFEDDVDTITIFIKDSGNGMDTQTIERIFDPFYREDSSRSGDDLSLGVGLTITKELVELLKGNIKIDSKKHVGTTVTLTFKKRRS
jgi:signal transduction histidine kinase